jgi:hypothetical protein
MRAARRRALLRALAVTLASLAAAAATSTTALALTIGLPAVEITVPRVEVSVGTVHASTPQATVTTPSVGVTTLTTPTTPSQPVEVPETPVTGRSAPTGGLTTGQTSSGSGSSSAGAAKSTNPDTSSAAPAAPTSTPASTPVRAARSHPGFTSTQGDGQRSPARHPHGKAVAGAVAATGVPVHAGGSRDPRPTQAISTATSSASNPLAAIGGRLGLPLPVPDWSKPIILLLLVLALALGARARINARRARRLEVQRSGLLSDVHAMQVALVPEVPPHLAATDISVAYRPADGVAAGGDFYDVFELEPGHLALVLGDVCGHGREALDRAALTRYTIRAYLQAGLEPRAALALAGQVLADPSCAHFATVLAGVYDSTTSRLTYASAGHPAPIVLGPGAPAPVEVCCSPPVGWSVPTGRRQTSIPLPAGTVVCFFTDGLTEARCEDGLLGTERLAQLLGGVGPHPTASALVDRVTDEATATPDDMAACVLVSQAQNASGSRVEELELDPRSLEGDAVPRFLAACGLTERAVADLIARAGALLASSDTAVVRIEIVSGTPHALVFAPEEAPAYDLHARAHGSSVRAPSPAHA